MVFGAPWDDGNLHGADEEMAEFGADVENAVLGDDEEVAVGAVEG